MSIVGIIGKVIGGTQYFYEDGTAHAVTAIEAGPCTITQIKSLKKDGYQSVQLGFER
ncbi:MAG: 50S ribosomal protein L3, partial [Dehalococcoidia bacterium]|nr:50S ribosomal protein L3 [Dehalococcoidia bacterium]